MHRASVHGALLLANFALTSVAVAQGFGPAMMESTPSSYRAVGFSMPAVTATKETVARLEFNLAGQGALSIEGTMKKKRQEISEKEQQETGESLEAEGYAAAMHISRYSSGMDMSGFFWSLGVGYREERLKWTVAPEDNDPQANFSLVNDKNLFDHEATAKGTTGSLRVGYRFVGSSVPIIVGIYLGARHFQAGVEDAEAKEGDQASYDQNATDPMTDREKERLRRRVTTAPDAGLEVGFAF